MQRRGLGILSFIILIVYIAGPLESSIEVRASQEARAVFIVGIHSEPDWRDMMVPCIAPAAKRVCLDGKPIVLLVAESNGRGQLSGSQMDFLSLYNPDEIYLIGLTSINPSINAKTRVISPGNEVDASVQIALAFWNSSEKVVITLKDDYKMALLASTIASHLDIPLLYVESPSLPKSVQDAIEKLGVSQAIIVANAILNLSEVIKSTILLSNETQVARYISQTTAVDYVIMINPLDRTSGMVKKTILSFSHIGSGKGGDSLSCFQCYIVFSETF